jgi:hypothetical protein
MNESTTTTTNYLSPATSLAAICVKVRQLNLLGPARTQAQIQLNPCRFRRDL